jgi:ABC-type uncharacterized transport system YnjBCD permease subunit
MSITLPPTLAAFQRTSTKSQSRQDVDARTLGAMAAVVFLALLVVLSVLALLGYGADSRDPEYCLGKVLTPRPASGDHSR